MTAIYGTLGPKCSDIETLKEMFMLGMTGVRLNLSHTTLEAAADQISVLHAAAAACGTTADLLIDMQGPELRIGKLAAPILLKDGEILPLDTLPLPSVLLPHLKQGQELLLDDGKLRLTILNEDVLNEDATHSAAYSARVLRGGLLSGGKSIALPGCSIRPPAMTGQDIKNLRAAEKYGVTGVMQPFVRSAEDLLEVRSALAEAGCRNIRLFAKIENMDGVENLDSFFPLADEIVIARGDLGNAMPLWQLPIVQKEICARCRAAGKPFMVVTQMLASMEHCAVPTRAEVSDIANAVFDGAASVMVTGETAIGDYPIEVIRYLANTVREAERYTG